MDKLTLEDVTPASEVTKSRRNLVIISFSSIAYSILAPRITEIKIAGIEVGLADNISILALIAGGLLFETATFVLRFINCHYAMRLSKMIDARISIESDIAKTIKTQSKNDSQTKGTSSEVDLQSQIIGSWLTRLDSIKEEQQTQLERILGWHRLVELYMPIALASMALTLCISKIIS